ncbi:hypothetical protein GCM10010168_85850 [Actinoplanes ianthinogenes]|uniref:Uncharacterized protein n=1 Tax=Actinoplanes ianthinogenes TaxID=122358 RepID=A0ABM7M139_9ACTN|nr:hypothetical protein [Actinoplanes ianthinogenes]BCJ45316.1 hypothetical protein Aiant_59730 [Actinoplanes ianthinogenes]GGR53739.1 hypothetical protein GCM10010168_85850 [Actinoplanes ianthinogenes]
MGSFAANNITTWFSGYDMTADLNSTQLALSYDALEDTAFLDGARSRIAGLEDAQLSEAGWWQGGAANAAVDPVAFAALGGTPRLVTNSPDGAEQSVAYFYRARTFSYQTFGQVGEVMPFQLSAQSAKVGGVAGIGAVRGRVLKSNRTANVTATGAVGTAFQLGAVAAGQYLYAGLHAFAVGTTLTGVVESAPDNTFGAATTRITFSGITTVGDTWGARVAGPITDTWYRLRITAITGTFTVACIAGIK